MPLSTKLIGTHALEGFAVETGPGTIPCPVQDPGVSWFYPACIGGRGR